tara:strand:- start:6 stop:1094 length:1089 start_codon:yes stop_codon:yes gene_type:complete
MIIAAFINKYSESQFSNNENWDSNLALLDLANWIPFFFLFWAFGNLLNTTKKRRDCAMYLISGSVPLIISGFLQLLTSIHGPFETFNGLLIWYQREIQRGAGVSAIFNNANYYASWLLIIWPFALANFLKKDKNKIKKTFNLILILAISSSIALTRSRSAWGSIFLSIPMMLGTTSLIWLIPILVMIFSLIFLAVIPINNDIQFIIQSIIPSQFWQEFSSEQFINSTRELRINIWIEAFNLIGIRPYLGFGAGLFPLLYLSSTGSWVGHTHNIFIELAFNYGIFTSITFLGFVIFILFKSYKKIYEKSPLKLDKKGNLFNKAWWISTITIFITQLVDIQYYDGRISVALWILLSGIRSILLE